MSLATYTERNMNPLKIEDLTPEYFQNIHESSTKFWGEEFIPTLVLSEEFKLHSERLLPIAAENRIKIHFIGDPYDKTNP